MLKTSGTTDHGQASPTFKDVLIASFHSSTKVPELILEQEQWRIFVGWNEDYEAGIVGTDSHPGHPGTNQRWDEIKAILKAARKSVPGNAQRAKAQMTSIEDSQRYRPSGPAYLLSWRLL